MFFGERLKQAREIRGLTQSGLSAALAEIASVKITQSQLSRYESGDALPDIDVVALLAMQLGVEYRFFESRPGASIEPSSPQLRSRSRLLKRTQYAAIQWGNIVQGHYAAIGKQLDMPPERLSSITPGEPTVVASRVRQLMSVGPSEPVGALLLQIERLGVTVLGIPFRDEQLDAYCAWSADDSPVMVILAGAPGDRLRFSAAHELGHLILHRGQQERSQQFEAEADEFAAALLTPSHALKYDLPTHPTLTSLTMVKTKWGVSIKSLIRRCRELGIIDQERATSLYRQISARGWNKKEPGYVEMEKPRGFRKACEVLYGDTGTVKLLAEDARWSLDMAHDVLGQHASAEELPSALWPAPSLKGNNVIAFRRV